jgi:hypothetical protein
LLDAYNGLILLLYFIPQLFDDVLLRLILNWLLFCLVYFFELDYFIFSII